MTAPDPIRIFALKLIVACYGYSLAMASAGVISCELRKPGECSSQWMQAFTVAGGATTTMWAYITESPPPGSAREQKKANDETEAT